MTFSFSRSRREGRKKFGPKVDLPKGNPIDGQAVTGDISVDDQAEVDAIVSVFRATNDAINRTIGGGYWVAVVFPDETTCRQFVAKAGWNDILDGRSYVDGLALAERMGISLEVLPIKFHGQRADRKLIENVGLFTGRGK